MHQGEEDNHGYSNEFTLLRALLGQKVLVIGHRGLGISSLISGQLPENTIPSIAMAFVDGADMVELDITLTWDNYIVVFHDDRLSRTTNGLGSLQNHTLETMRSLDAGLGTYWEGKQIHVPTLQEVFHFVLKEHKHHSLNIELKPYSGRPSQAYEYRNILIDRFVRLVEDYNVADRILVSSFDWRMLFMLHRKSPTLVTALLAAKAPWDLDKMIFWAKKLGFQGIHPHFSLITKQSQVKKARKQGLFVQPYGLDSEAQFRQAVAWGVQGIITDTPERLRHYLQFQENI
jgi:glycerophosphoryl diester phosphodiesterase